MKSATLALFFVLLFMPLASNAMCPSSGAWLQVLGSGGPELDDGRASTSYLLWVDGKARILIDMGSGALQRFEQSGAELNDLDLVLFTHLHVDHSNDFPGLIKGFYFSDRKRDLPVYGPGGNSLMPSMTEFVQGLFGTRGIYRYLNEYIDGSGSYRIRAYDVDAQDRQQTTVFTNDIYRIRSVSVHHGPIPALAWRIDVGARSFVISGDMNNDRQSLAGLAHGAEVLVAHHAIPENAGRIARNLHMTPSEIGDIAAQAKAKHLVLSHRMQRTLGREAESKQHIRKRYNGPVQFADDLLCL